MIEVINTQNKPIKSWVGEDIEEAALKQANNLANLPFIHKHVALMPDAHCGYGMPIGGVIATENVIIPNAVGVDIGCGMCAVKTSLTVDDIDKDLLKKIMGKIRKEIPVGFNKHKEMQDFKLMPSVTKEENRFVEHDVLYADYPVVFREYKNARKSLGTLGGGNHFVEIQKDTFGHIWIMIHSGSRNLGKQVADHYNKIAVDLNKKWFSSVPKEHQLAFLPTDSEEGKAYIREMEYCVDFAFANRKLMMDKAMSAFVDFVVNKEVSFEPMINIAHNYARLENHFGKNVWVHRKGATSAKHKELGIIPGSQGTKSYIVEGLGNKESFMSCSHGAGRKMSRTKAKNELDLRSEIDKMNNLGIIHGIRNNSDLDEAPSAYKDIASVMRNQIDLVRIMRELMPLAVIKG